MSKTESETAVDLFNQLESAVQEQQERRMNWIETGVRTVLRFAAPFSRWVTWEHDLYLQTVDFQPSLTSIAEHIDNINTSIPCILKFEDDFYIFGLNKDKEIHMTQVKEEDKHLYQSDRLPFSGVLTKITSVPINVINNMTQTDAHIPWLKNPLEDEEDVARPKTSVFTS